jgi:two-component system cell cycle response regulator
MAESLTLRMNDRSAQDFKILVADDSRLYRKLVEETLAQEQYAVCFAKNGREASDLLAKHRPALVITDWEMPDVTGIELCGQIRSNQGAYTYIILLTSNADKAQIISGLAAGADDYLTKPFHSGELLARVGVGRRIVELHREIQGKNRLLEELALTDPLTGLPNRRAIEDWSVRQLSGAVRHGFPFWVVMADLDSFKSVNDTFGHEAGDLVLKRFAGLLRANTRASNICGRIGGEEFLVVLTHVEKPNIQIVVDRIRHQLEAEEFTFGGRTLRVTASFGISGFQGGEAPKFDQLMREADAALYTAKRTGRNRLEFEGGMQW